LSLCLRWLIWHQNLSVRACSQIGGTRSRNHRGTTSLAPNSSVSETMLKSRWPLAVLRFASAGSRSKGAADNREAPRSVARQQCASSYCSRGVPNPPRFSPPGSPWNARPAQAFAAEEFSDGPPIRLKKICKLPVVHSRVKRQSLERIFAYLVPRADEVIKRSTGMSEVWHFCDIARSRMNFRFRRKSGRAADTTGMTEFDPTRSLAAQVCCDAQGGSLPRDVVRFGRLT
jgi:hypothetical protein